MISEGHLETKPRAAPAARFFSQPMTFHADKNSISHLIRLMDDADSYVRSRVHEQLIHIGEDALPFLEMAAREENPKRRSIARNLIHAIHPQKLAEKFRQLVFAARGGDLDLEQGMKILVEFGYPDADPETCTRSLDRLADILSRRLSPKDSPEECLRKLAEFLFQEQGFVGNEADYFNPDNSYFNRVLERKTGLPITLSALCILVGKRLHLPIAGVGLPRHFIAKYDRPVEPIFFDPFHRGRQLTREECILLVQSMGQPFQEQFLSRATDRETLVRMMSNLIMIYTQNNEEEKAHQLTQYVKILLNAPQSFSSKSA